MIKGLIYQTKFDLDNISISSPVVMISGYFDPIQPGHVDYINYAKSREYLSNKCLSPFVIAVIHTPEDIVKKSGFYVYECSELKCILLGFGINNVIVSEDTDGTVAKTIRKIKPDYFIKGPDRNPENMVKEELEVCEDIGCKVIYQPGVKVNSSSNIKTRIRKQLVLSP